MGSRLPTADDNTLSAELVFAKQLDLR